MSAGYKRRSLALTRTLDGSQFKVESRRPLAALSFACCETCIKPPTAGPTATSFNAENVTRLPPRDSPNYPMFHIFIRRATLPKSSQFSKGPLYNTTSEWTTSDQRAASPLNYSRRCLSSNTYFTIFIFFFVDRWLSNFISSLRDIPRYKVNFYINFYLWMKMVFVFPFFEWEASVEERYYEFLIETESFWMANFIS